MAPNPSLTASVGADHNQDVSSSKGKDSADKFEDETENINDDSDDSGGGSRSDASSVSSNGGGSGLFISSTISRDDTLSKVSKKRGMLSKLNDQFNDGTLQLNNSNVFRDTLGVGYGMSELVPPPPIERPRRLPLMVPPGPRYRPPGRFRPPVGKPLPAHIPPPGPAAPLDYPVGLPPRMIQSQLMLPRYPSTKSSNTRWRRQLLRKRGLILGSKRDETQASGSNSELPLPERPFTQLKNPVETPRVTVSSSDAIGLHTDEDMRPSSIEHPGSYGSKRSASHGQLKHKAAFADTPEASVQSDSQDNDASHLQQVAEVHALDKKNRPERKPGLAESLSYLTEQHLNIDLLDDNQEVSRFISYLFDTIQMLENQIRYNAADSSSSSGSDSEDDQESVGPPVPRCRVVHRIFCTNSLHAHDGDMYEDEPRRASASSNGDSGLEAQVEIINLRAYLSSHPEVCFVVIKEHNCALDARSAAIRVWTSGKSGVTSERSERLRIVSPLIQKALAQVAEFQIYDEPGDREFDEPTEMDAPYLFLFHHRAQLAALAKQETYTAVLSPLLEFLKDNYEQEYQEAEDMFRQGYVNALHLDKLFKPNQMVINCKNPEALEAFILKKYTTVEKNKICFRGWTWQYNGTDLSRTNYHSKMDLVSEEKTRISDLNIHPTEFARDENIKRLTSRGMKFWDMKGQVYTSYTGWDKGREHYYSGARFMVDTATYQLMHRGSLSGAHEDPQPYKFDTWPTKIGPRDELPVSTVMLLPATTYGFNLHEKKWVNLNIENLHPVDWNKKAFDRLVLEPKTKEMIYALVDVQTSAKKMDDIITGKGNGLIVLLHGSPGTGKTLTAESVAEIAEKPLYRVTCGDIGIDARDVEKYLQTVMYLGKIWDCVLLLDEADVFLEERTMADLQRNSLVSVFLRILEYYEGILILTSNRVGTFDEAFKSRIQVAIHYDDLTKKSRKAIWRNFFDMIEESSDEDANMPELERRLDQLAQEEMNGRQIRNALLTSRQLAKHRNERLDWEHLSQVMKTSAAFNKYLKAVRGHSDEQWAREEMLR
ncbi:AAA family ATPase [Colletotrichum higginsianum IMI 349063]|uniref:AAA family ATPase n=1 Tax=Colletotrichum higginsianum (strain IMI 349063) TaxID=759273 RepID=A0A1B7YQ29_COLHI|nr:AAA family ATPase [Colletotrichum higginsianum IMI 349063]OBR14150.1 AAA family ATPase [Colletotrichum higginsianum IMI 349063]